MTGVKTSQLGSIEGSAVVAADRLLLLDVSDTSQGAGGSLKSISHEQAMVAVARTALILQLLESINFATDNAAQNTRELLLLRSGVDQYDIILEQMAGGILAALELAGNAARALAGGDVLVGAGTLAAPSLAQSADRDTGFYFPAAATIAAVIAGIEAFRIDSNGRLGLGTTAPSGRLDVADTKIRVRDSATPASATAAGNKGEVCWDANYIYVCIDTNTWRRSALGTW